MAEYKKLIVWQKGMNLCEEVYLITKKLPKEELFGLTNQLRRAAVSIPSNIAEGYGRYSDKEFIYFLKVARGSTAEVETQLLLCFKLGYVAERDLQTAMSLVREVFSLLTRFILNAESNK